MNFYKRFLGDFTKKTRHLTLLHQGAYNVLLDAFYSTEKPLPHDHQKLYRMVGAFTQDEQDAVTEILNEFWTLDETGYVNERAMEEIVKFRERSEKNRQIALDREEAKRTNRATERSTKTALYHSHSQNVLTNHPSKFPARDGGGGISNREWSEMVDQWKPGDVRDPQRIALIPEFKEWAKTKMKARTEKALQNAWWRFIRNHT